MDYSTFENLFVSVMTPMSVGFFLLWIGILVTEATRIFINETFGK